MITTDALMIVTGLVLVECVRSEVQHTIVEVLVAQNQFVGLRLLLWSLTLSLGHEHTIVEITLVHCPQVDQAEHEDNSDGILLLQLAVHESQKDACTY